MTDAEEAIYIQGQQQVYLTLLKTALAGLGARSTEVDKVRWVLERAEVVLLLRQLCREYGDNDWSNSLHLCDVIEKHLMRHLDLP